jgi:hypothetical protein
MPSTESPRRATKSGEMAIGEGAEDSVATGRIHVPRKQKSCQDYLLKVDTYLERLLLLIHLTAGQPARGSETLSLRSVNTLNGHHRNVFIEGGMVSTVTTFHKGYSTTGDTKIIHRYLPKEVGELLVYYLWLVQPFCRNLEMLALRRRDHACGLNAEASTLLKYSTLERVAFQLYTLPLLRRPFETCRVPSLHPAG